MKAEMLGEAIMASWFVCFLSGYHRHDIQTAHKYDPAPLWSDPMPSLKAPQLFAVKENPHYPF